jgi:hypothetical protein
MKNNQTQSTITGFNQDGTKRVIKVWGFYNQSQAIKLMKDIEGQNYKSVTVN